MMEIIVNDRTIILDDDDYEIYKTKNIQINKKGYPFYVTYSGKRGSKRRRKYLHKLIGTPRKGYVIDHVNRNTLDVRKCNLREATYFQNARNRRSIGGNSKYKGVTLNSSNNWKAGITYRFKRIHIGTFDNEIDAAIAYDIWCDKLDKVFYLKNFEDGHPDTERIRLLLDKKVEIHNSVKVNKRYRGVKYLKDKKSYAAFINYKNKRYKLMTSKNQEELAIAYDTAAIILYPDNHKLNFTNKEPIPKIKEKALNILKNT